MRRDKYAVRLDPGLEVMSERLAITDCACVLATVISAAGSTYRKPGARMLIESDGRITGLLSGGCLEQDLREYAAGVLSSGIARTVTYDMRADNDLIFGIGAGCEGSLGILMEPAPPGSRAANAVRMAGDSARESDSTLLVTIHDAPAAQLGTYLWRAQQPVFTDPLINAACARASSAGRAAPFTWRQSSYAYAAWIEPVSPLPAVLICGAGPDAAPVAAACRALHYPLTIADHRAAYALAERFPGATVTWGAAATLASRVDLQRFFAAVVMSHHLASDTDYLRVLATTDMDYIGVLGPRSRRERLLAELGSAAIRLNGRLRGPIGLDIGAVTPEGIALAIMAEIHAAAAGRAAQSFKQHS